jgi:class 3 adenylate cyclase/tetratricopeptide (TPR) repeat protein
MAGTTPAGQTRKTVTALFCDLTGSTALGEQLDPESLREIIQGYFAEMRSVIERHGGKIEKFIGDAVMAVFGVPRVHEDDALRAVRAAADMQTALTTANQRFEKDFGVRLQARIGVNTGEVIAADPATEDSFVSGDPINTAARIEQAAEPGDVLLGESTYRLVRSAVIAEPVDPIMAKGKAEPLQIYRLVLVDPGSEMLPRRLDAPLVGRWDELERMRATLADVRSSSTARLVTVLGEPGIGKSRLAHELVSIACDGARVLRGRCLPYGDGITFWPVAELLEDAAGVEPGDSNEQARTKIAALLPPEHQGLVERLCALLGAGDAGGSIQETFLAVRRALEALASQQPVLVIFDDIQWGEDAFIDLIRYLVAFAGASPLFIVCLARPELLDTQPDWGQTSELIRLAPLDGAGSETLVGNLLGTGTAPADVASTIAQAAGGNPLFIEEMLRMLVDQGVLTIRGSDWALTGDLADFGRPETVHAVISARLDRLDPGEKAALQTASIMGEVFWWSAIADLSDDATPIDVARRLQALVRKDLIRPDPSTFFSEDAFRFGHLLIRDVAYASLPKKARADVHERFARWVEERAKQRPGEFDEIIGYHAEMASRYLTELGRSDEKASALADVAATRLSTAGFRRFDGGDMAAAISLLSRAGGLWSPDDRRRFRVQMFLAQALERNGRFDDAVEAYRQAGDIGHVLGDRAAESRADMGREFIRLVRSASMSHDDFIEVIDRALGVFEELSDDSGIAEALRFRAVIDVWAGHMEVALARFERSLEAAGRGADVRAAGDAWHWMVLALTEGPTPAPHAIQRIRAYEEATGETPWIHLHRVGDLLSMIGDDVAARAAISKGIERAEEMGMEVDLAAGMLRSSADVYYRVRELDKAEADLRRAVDTLERIGDKGHLASVAPDLARILLATPGREEEALAAAVLGEEASIEDDADAQVRWRATKGLATFRLGRREEGERLVRSAQEQGWRTDYFKLRAIPLEALGEILQVTGRADQAADAFRRALEVYEAKGDVTSIGLLRRQMTAYELTI